jgi:hypothetical protein
MAEAKAGGYDCIITIGGIQSNHCRATAVVCVCGDPYPSKRRRATFKFRPIDEPTYRP